MRVHTERLLDMIEEFRRIRPTMPGQAIAVFLMVALNPGITIGRIAKRLNTTVAAAGRNASVLGEIDYQRHPGLDLIWADTDPDNERRKQLWLTERGRRLVGIIEAIGEGRLIFGETDPPPPIVLQPIWRPEIVERSEQLDLGTD